MTTDVVTVGKVKNWAEFQHYKDRAPPWLKLHRGLLDDFDYACLPLASKALAPLLWLLASENIDGSVRVDAHWLAFRLRWKIEDVDAGLTPLILSGFIIVASDVLAECEQRAIPETEGETEGETEFQSSLRSDSPSADADGQADAKVKTEAKAQRLAIVTDEAIAEYNTAMTAPAGVLSKVSPKIGRDKRRNQVKRCLKTASEICVEQFDSPAVTPQFWKTYFAECAADPFRSGRQSGGKDHTNWKPGFEYLTREAVMLEVFERAVSEGGA